ncbi:MAG: hypothetical protein QME78_03775 [Thermodesulfobacteriota bacterium]|nr:hypothetical protein [Thermodesulfobacteriota bacterium]
MEGEEKKELTHEPMPIYIPIFWVVVIIALLYLALIALRIIS